MSNNTFDIDNIAIVNEYIKDINLLLSDEKLTQQEWLDLVTKKN